MSKLILVVGASGTGKTSLSLSICTHFGFKYFHAGGLRRTPSQGFISHQKSIIRAVIENRMKSNKTLVIDAHNCIQNGIKTQIIPTKIIKELNPHLIILVEPTLKQTIKQIKEDNKRKRPTNYTKKEINFSRIMFYEFVRKYNTPHIIISNNNESTSIKLVKNKL